MRIAERLIAGETLSQAEWQQLEVLTLQKQLGAEAFGVTQENVAEVVRQRSGLLQLVFPALKQFCHSRFKPVPLHSLWYLWLPLTLQLAEQRRTLERPFIQGVLGGQGTGKTTLGAVLSLILQQLGYETLSLSLDDLYKTYADRQRLQQQDPRFVWRGPPGTHDVDLGIQVLTQLRQPNPQGAIAIPRFDKSLHSGLGDQIEPEQVVEADIVLFEGWFVGVCPIDPSLFDQAPAPIVTEADRTFARDINTKLRAYLPLWQQLDSLIVLYPNDYRFSKQWRQQAEQEMAASGKVGMSDAEIDAFVDYFWKALHPELFIKPLISNPERVNLVIEIQEDHTIDKIYRPNRAEFFTAKH